MVAWIAWAASFLLPVAGIRADGGLFKGDAMFSGWQIVWMILSDPPRAFGDAGRIALWFTAITNLIVLASPIAEVAERPRIRRTFKVLATSAAHLNAFAALPYAMFLSYGYLVWLGSFILLAWALWRG